jgi:pimeloyl-ACP methyl ester carboxylesterase
MANDRALVPTVAAWERLGEYRQVTGHRIFTVAAPPLGAEALEPLLVLHGFPTSSFDFRAVLDELRRNRRVYLLDMLGYGLSDKPDLAYTIALQADIVVAFTSALDITALALVTHDMGNTVGGELLARQMEGSWPVDVTRRVVTNGSIYIDMAHLSAGQLLLLGLPDERLAGDGPIDGAAVEAGVAATFSPRSNVGPDELAALGHLVVHNDGHLMLPRLIRYIEERRRHEARFTGAIEEHPSPLGIVWGLDDPIAVASMVDRLHSARPDARVSLLEGVGHYPMIEAPERFATAVHRAIAGDGE